MVIQIMPSACTLLEVEESASTLRPPDNYCPFRTRGVVSWTAYENLAYGCSRQKLLCKARAMVKSRKLLWKLRAIVTGFGHVLGRRMLLANAMLLLVEASCITQLERTIGQLKK